MSTGVLANLVGPDGIIILVLLIVVLLFGGNKLPKLARGLGSASHEFKKGMESGDPAETEASADKDKSGSGS